MGSVPNLPWEIFNCLCQLKDLRSMLKKYHSVIFTVCLSRLFDEKRRLRSYVRSVTRPWEAINNGEFTRLLFTISNGLIALCGSLLAQNTDWMQLGTGTIVGLRQSHRKFIHDGPLSCLLSIEWLLLLSDYFKYYEIPTRSNLVRSL